MATSKRLKPEWNTNHADLTDVRGYAMEDTHLLSVFIRVIRVISGLFFFGCGPPRYVIRGELGSSG